MANHCDCSREFALRRETLVRGRGTVGKAKMVYVVSRICWARQVYVSGPSHVQAKTSSTTQLPSGENCCHEPFLHTLDVQQGGTNGQTSEIPWDCTVGCIFHGDG